MAGNIETVLQEKRVFPPSPEMVKQANISGMEAYRKLCAEGHRPICQDTGIVNVFVKIGMDVRFDFSDFEETINEGVRRGLPGCQGDPQVARAGVR